MKSPIVQALVAFVTIAIIALGWTYQHRALVHAQRDAEDARLTLKNQIVEHESTRRQLQGSVDDLLKDNAALNAAFDVAMAASPGASPASVSRLDTGPLVVKRPPSVAANPVVALKIPTKDSPGPAPESTPCAVTYDDQLSVIVEEIELTTKAANTLIVGTAMIYAESLEKPRRLLATGQFHSELSSTQTLEAPAPPRWGAQVAGLCTRDGCGLGAGVLLPPAKFLGLRWESSVTAYAAPLPALAGALGVRW